MIPRIVGLDASLTATGLAPPDGGSVTLSVRTTGAARLYELTTAIHGWVSGNVDLVAIEGYSYASRNGTHQLGELGGCIRLDLWRAGIPYVEIPPNSLKKYATGRGNASKDEMLAAAIRRLGYEGHDHNQADALWLREMARDAYGERWQAAHGPGALNPALPRVPASHRAALTAITWPVLPGLEPSEVGR